MCIFDSERKDESYSFTFFFFFWYSVSDFSTGRSALITTRVFLHTFHILSQLNTYYIFYDIQYVLKEKIWSYTHKLYVLFKIVTNHRVFHSVH